jgi:glucosamine--fructose-6-phosphate aminotransferase (isomerizing)
MTITAREIASQPSVWRVALLHVDRATELLVRPGERMLVLGCGTSAFVAESFAQLREGAGYGMTDAAYASEPRAWRDYDRVLAITRSGTTSEVIDAIRLLPVGVPVTVVTGVADSPVTSLATDVLLLDFADEESVVQTRFPTSFLILARAALGEDVAQLPDEAEVALAKSPLASYDIDVASFDHFVYLGSGWSYGLAQEAALKIREAAQAWSESYPLLDYRHGPLAVAHSTSLVWMMGRSESALAEQIRATGATVICGEHDPLIELALAQKLAVEVADARGLNPDTPRYLTRSIVLN